MITGSLPHNVDYVTDSSGLIFKRAESGASVNPLNYYYYLAGKRMGDAGNTGKSQLDYDLSIFRRRKDPVTFPNGNVDAADFGPAYDPINISSGIETGAGQTYAVRTGDTLRAIAEAFWGDASALRAFSASN